MMHQVKKTFQGNVNMYEAAFSVETDFVEQIWLEIKSLMLIKNHFSEIKTAEHAAMFE